MTSLKQNGKTETYLPSLEVAKTYPNMTASPNIDWLLHIHYARRDFKTCKKIIERELPIQLNPEYLLFVKGLIERYEGNQVKALQTFQKVIDYNSKNIEAYKEIGKTLFHMGQLNQALEVFHQIEDLQLQPDTEIFYYIGEILYRSTATTKSRNSDNNRAQPDPDTSSSHKQEEAKRYFQKSIQNGNQQKCYQRLAEIYRKEQNYRKAIEVLECCLHQVSPDNSEILIEIGILYLKMNDSEKAFNKLTEAFHNDEKSAKGLLAFGAILQSKNNIDDALMKYKQTTGSDLQCAELWNNIGLCFFKKKKFIAAISCLRKAIWLSPLNYNSLYNLSLILISEAYEDYILKLKIENVVNRNFVHFTYFHYNEVCAHQYASAFHTLAAAVNLRKNSSECYMLLGICLQKLDDYDNAFIAFERSTSFACQGQTETNGNPLIYLNFALFCYETGRINLSIENYNRFMKYTKNSILPIDLKFQATKLKSYLKISVKSFADNEQCKEDQESETKGIALEVDAVVHDNKCDD